MKKLFNRIFRSKKEKESVTIEEVCRNVKDENDSYCKMENIYIR